MITYSLLAVAALFVLARWVFFWSCKRKAMTHEQMDAALIDRLNAAEVPHDR
ncbi:hypothetical protein ACFFNY_03795 [Paenibacillus hodogayensis]|uniref:DUF4083 domain-containing protein n=1 Tax=Paenibacillus hodogayensis TaxID=279208 RepID=A0ABV5VQY5_9BACL